MRLLHEQNTRTLIRGFFEVHNEVGLGRHEEAYQRAYELWIEENGLPVLSKPAVPLYVAGREAIILYPDFVAWNDICVELKALPRHIGPSEELQLFDYLRACGIHLGIIVNFGLDRVHFERRVYSPPATCFTADWSHWSNRIDGDDREIGCAIRDALTLLFNTHQTGYSQMVTEKLFLASIEAFGLNVVIRPVARAFYRHHLIHESELDCFLIENRFVVTLTAHFDNNEYCKSLGLSHLKTLGLPWGIATNFGINELQVTALRFSNC